MDLTLRSDDGPLYEQIARSVRAAVASGELSRGDRLPSARDLADGLGVSYHTVLQAFEVLAAEGVIDVRRGRGVLVAAAPDQQRLHNLARDLMAEARRQGLSRAAVRKIVEQYG
jgi:GntR family transcriptional regulator